MTGAGLQLQDYVYLGSVWQHLQQHEGDPEIPFGGDFSPVRLERSDDGVFFAGIAERTGPDGRVTDVVLSFAGALTADDFAEAALIVAGGPSAQVDRALDLFDEIIGAPRYENAKVHVTGHSLGAGLSQFVLGHSLAAYGPVLTDARVNVVQFGDPGFGQAVANRFGLTLSDFDGRIVAYRAENDITPAIGGVEIGTRVLLALYEPYDPILFGALNASAAHQAYTYIDGLGLPAWLDDMDRQSIFERLSSRITTERDLAYGPPGRVSLQLLGDGADNLLGGSQVDDVIVGGPGADTLHGGGGSNSFVYQHAADSAPGASDLIKDWSVDDRIDLSALAAQCGKERLTFVGQSIFTGIGQVRFYLAGGDTWVAANLTGDQSPELLIQLKGRHMIEAGNLQVGTETIPLPLGFYDKLRYSVDLDLAASGIPNVHRWHEFFALP